MSLGFFGSIGMFGAARVTAAQRQANAAAKKAAAQQKAIQRQETAAQKQLTAAQGKANQTAALQAREAGLAAKLQALQAGQTIKQAAQAQRTATTQTRAALKPVKAALPPGEQPVNVNNYLTPSAGMTPGGTNVSPYAVTPPPVAAGGGYSIPPSFRPQMTIQPPAGGYSVGGPQAAPGAYTPMQSMAPGGYTVGPQGPGGSYANVPTSPYGTAIGPTPYAGTYTVEAPGSAVYAAGAPGVYPGSTYAAGSMGGITAYTSPRAGDTRACTNKRTALSKAYQHALKAVQKNPNSKALTNFQKRYPKLVTALQKKCVTAGLLPGQIQPQFVLCPQGMVQNPCFGRTPDAQNRFTGQQCFNGNVRCLPGQPGFFPGTGFQPPPGQPSFYPGGGSGAQPGETVWQGGGYQGGAYMLSPEGAPYAGDSGGLIPAGGGSMSNEDDTQYTSAVIGPVSGRDSDNIPIQGDDGVTDALDPSVLAMSESDAGDFTETGTSAHFESSDFSGLSGLGTHNRIGRSRSERKLQGHGRKRSLPLLAMR